MIDQHVHGQGRRRTRARGHDSSLSTNLTGTSFPIPACHAHYPTCTQTHYTKMTKWSPIFAQGKETKGGFQRTGQDRTSQSIHHPSPFTMPCQSNYPTNDPKLPRHLSTEHQLPLPPIRGVRRRLGSQGRSRRFRCRIRQSLSSGCRRSFAPVPAIAVLAG